MSGNGMNEMNNLVRQIAAAYLAAQGHSFEAHGVRLPLCAGVMVDAIGEHITAPVMADEGEEGQAGALALLANMLNGDALSAFGRQVLDTMLAVICADIKQFDDDRGIDPLASLPESLRDMGPRVIGGYRNQTLIAKPVPDFQTTAPILADNMARAFVDEVGPFYFSEGADGAPRFALALTVEEVAATIRFSIVDGAAHGLGEAFALHLLQRSIDEEALTDYGYHLIRSMLEEVCETARQMMAEGRDPRAEIAKMQAKQSGRVGS